MSFARSCLLLPVLASALLTGGCVAPSEAPDFLHAQVTEVFRSSRASLEDARAHGTVAGMLERFLRRKGFRKISSTEIPKAYNFKVATFDPGQQQEVYYLGGWHNSDEFLVLLRHTLPGGSQVSARVFWYTSRGRFEAQEESVNQFTQTLSAWWAVNDPFRSVLAPGALDR